MTTNTEQNTLLNTTFLNNISHEVRSHLNGISGFGSLLSDPDVTKDERMRYFSMLQSSGNRLMNTITDYINISLLISGNLTAHPSHHHTKSIIDFSKNKFSELSAGKALKLNIVIPQGGDDIVFTTDFDLLKIVIHHLLDNAIKFTDKEEVSFGFTINEKNIEFFVKDKGPGIDRESQIELFEMFSQRGIDFSEVGRAKGHGLYIVKGILSLLNGHIRLESSRDNGNNFYFSLPFKKEILSVINEIQLSDMTEKELPVVLAVDDEETNNIYIEAVLRKYASKIIKAFNGKEAVDICRNNPDISIVLMDIKMPVMNGLDATREIKSFRKNLPIIAVTAYALADDEKIALEAGCDDYLAKPFTYARLIEKVKKYTT
ncbi:MAG: Sensor protein [uncultured bacterium]|nr:MAG: Sensor protein [uncultured bacterium]HBY01450.1 hypothetical protein [Rikenellaceae bacterium]